MSHIIRRGLAALASTIAIAAAMPALAQGEQLTLNDTEYYEGDAANVLVFSNWYDGLFADAKHSGWS